MRMFVFPFGSGDYDRQCAVVMADSWGEARRLLLGDIERQRAACTHVDREDSHSCDGENGFTRGYFTADRLDEAAIAAADRTTRNPDMAPFEIVGPVAYTYGLDG